MGSACQETVKAWFKQYLFWLNTHPYGVKEKMYDNNHAVCWSLQSAAYVDLIGDEDMLAWIRERFKSYFLASRMKRLARWTWRPPSLS